MSIKVKQAEFLGGAQKLSQLPNPGLPEIAFVGRSNVGKSTLINKLCSRKNLARTSSTPGRTQEINLFEITINTPQKQDRDVVISDLPGFGYAKFSKKKREVLSRLTVEYLTQRSALEVVCLLNDCRREPQEDELAIQELVFEAHKHLLVVLTKVDKLKKNDIRKQNNKLAAAYGLEAADLVLSGDKLSIEGLWERVLL